MNKLRALFPLAFVLPAIAWSQNTFPSSGNVGIGTTTPFAPLTVVGPLGSSSATSAGTGTSFAELFATTGKSQLYLVRSIGTWSDTWWELTHDSDNKLKLGFSSVPQAEFANGSARFFGTVGIGTTSPGYKLDVQDSTNVVARLYGTNAQSTYLFLQNSNTSTGWGVAAWANGNFVVDQYGAGNRFVISNTGNVGIGTTTPAAKLEVDSSSGGGTLVLGGIIGSKNDGYELNLVGSVPIDAGYTSQHGGQIRLGGSARGDTMVNGIQFLQNSVEVARIANGGNVGIGTTNPTYLLTVNGPIRAKEVIVDTGWSDYVFTPGYRLAPLHEVQQTIEKEGHLPGIPSAAEVARQGISVGDMQARLLAKIEELTLHVIDQEKRQERLAQTVEHLQQENAALRTALTALQKP